MSESPARERTVQTPSGVELAVSESGPPGAAPIVVLHGLIGTGQSVLRGSDLVAAGYRVIAYDARGHGRSGAPDDPRAYSYDLLVEDLRAVLDAVEAPRALLAGASMGALTSLRLALEQPDRVAGVMVITPACGARDKPIREHVERGDRIADALQARDLEAFLAVQPIGVGGVVPSSMVRNMAETTFEAHRNLDAVADAVRAVMRERALDDAEALRSLPVPTIVLGSYDEFDPSHPYELAEAYAETLPGSRLVCEKPGRLPLAWRPRQVARLVLEFANEIGYSPTSTEEPAHA
jgi:pimeloyl-ACP methyl ester carboxylesterase